MGHRAKQLQTGEHHSLPLGEELGHRQELSPCSSDITAGQNLWKGSSQATCSIFWRTRDVQWQSEWRSKLPILLKSASCPLWPHHTAVRGRQVSTCSLPWLCQGLWQGGYWDNPPEEAESPGIHGNLSKSLLSFLRSRLQCVLVNGKKSQPKPVLPAVPQGSVLGPLLFLILIGDIDKDIVTPFLSSFADDTRVDHAIASKEDMTQLQTNQETVYCWAARNDMKFNSDKFEFIRYSPTKSQLNTRNTQYYSNIGTPIQQQKHIRDLGVTISEDASFSQYINEKIATIKSKTGWVLRTFQTRDRKPILTLWKSLILSEHDYCCQLWNPHRTGEVQSMEVLQHFYIKKISGVSHLSYWNQLSKFKMYSLERRRERYIAIYIWEILEGTVPNVGSDNNAITATWHARRGRECNIPKISTTAPTRIQNIRKASFTVNGPLIFNSLPQYIRDSTKCDKNVFKAHLYHYLQRVPDQLLIPGYTA